MQKQIEVAAVWESIARLQAFADEVEQAGELTSDQLYLMRLVVEEIATNIIKYGYGDASGVIQFACATEADTVCITIRDHGQPFDPRHPPDPDLENTVEEREVGGLGIFFVREFADTISYNHDPASGWNELVVTKGARQRTLFELLRNVPLFIRLQDDALARLAERVGEQRLGAGEILFHQNEEGRNCYIILSGAMEVLTYVAGTELLLEVRQAGQIIGEMALIDRSPRSATVRALAETHLAVLDEQSFFTLMHNDPEMALEMLRSGTARLRRTSRDMISGLEAKNAELVHAYQELKAAQSELIRLGRLEEELAVARRIQELFLPRKLQPLPGWEVASFSRGAQAVGGDFFDYVELPDGRIGLVVADVSGKGVPAALFVALARSLLRAATQSPTIFQGSDALELDQRMTGAISLTNDYIVREHGESSMFITLFYGVLDPWTGVLRYVNAGHNPPLLMSNGGEQIRELEGGTLPIGIVQELPLAVETILIGPGESLIGFSDGITEAMDPAGEVYGDTRLVATLHANAALEATALVDAIVQDVEQYAASAPQADDMTLLIFRRAH